MKDCLLGPQRLLGPAEAVVVVAAVVVAAVDRS